LYFVVQIKEADVLFGDTFFSQFIGNGFHEAGFPAPSDSGYYLDAYEGKICIDFEG
jgi:hypothetical protein